MHLLFSPNLQNDDRMLENGTAGWEGTEVVITEKMDGEGTTFYKSDLHARSMEFVAHPSRTFIKAIHAVVAHNIPDGLRVCGENMTAVHSIHYENLPSYFMVFNVWNGEACLSWDETTEWCALLDLDMVPLIYRGPYSDDLCKRLCAQLNPETQEGLVVRPAASFSLADFPRVVGKWVRKSHVQTDQHWMQKEVEFNGLKEK